MTLLQASKKAPSFAIVNQHNKLVTLEEFSGKKNLVLYFYPKDDTPGCTVEAIEFSDLEDAFTALNAVVVGVSHDDCIRKPVVACHVTGQHLKHVERLDPSKWSAVHAGH